MLRLPHRVHRIADVPELLEAGAHRLVDELGVRRVHVHKWPARFRPGTRIPHEELWVLDQRCKAAVEFSQGMSRVADGRLVGHPCFGAQRLGGLPCSVTKKVESQKTTNVIARDLLAIESLCGPEGERGLPLHDPLLSGARHEAAYLE